LSAEGGVIGVLVAEHGRGTEKIARRTVEMVERFASHGALALRGAFLLEEVRRLASTDALTKIANRRTFDQVLARALERARRRKGALSLIIADIDHFKDVNDEYGHQAGDRLLRELASFLVRRVRSIDVVARYGGEEFAIIMPKCAPAEAAVRAEQLRLALADARLSHRVSVSFGVAAYPDHAGEASKLIVAADEALYRSKAAGRDRLTVFEIDAAKTRPATSRNGSKGRARAKVNSERRRRDVA
jgi:diguanylate cyclase (GGDEF)-like protein